jgi:hypothetical protein
MLYVTRDEDPCEKSSASRWERGRELSGYPVYQKQKIRKTISEKKDGIDIIKNGKWAKSTQKLKRHHSHHLNGGDNSKKNMKMHVGKSIEGDTKLNMNMKAKMNMNMKIRIKMNENMNMNWT